MLCIYVKRCFKSLICWLDLCLSSLLVAFISLCFSSLKNSFSSSLIASQQILFYWALLSSCLYRSYCNLDPLRFLDFFSIDTRQLLRSIEKIFVWLIDSRQLLDPSRYFCRQQILNSTLTDSFLSRFSARQILTDILIHRAAIST